MLDRISRRPRGMQTNLPLNPSSSSLHVVDSCDAFYWSSEAIVWYWPENQWINGQRLSLQGMLVLRTTEPNLEMSSWLRPTLCNVYNYIFSVQIIYACPAAWYVPEESQLLRHVPGIRIPHTKASIRGSLVIISCRKLGEIPKVPALEGKGRKQGRLQCTLHFDLIWLLRWPSSLAPQTEIHSQE
jgi:hypothetical protein